MFVSVRSALLAAAALATAALLPDAASAQTYGAQTYGDQAYGYGYGQTQSYGQSYGQGYSQSYGSGYSSYQPCQTGCGYNAPRRRYSSYNGQADVPGDYRCDAYWDASRTDCNAAWRDQRGSSRRYSSRARGYGYGASSSYAYGGAVYQGQYGQPDVIYSGGGYQGSGYQGGAYPDRYGHDHSGYGQYGRDQQRINWCCAEYRSYDPATGYYTAYSGERIFCG